MSKPAFHSEWKFVVSASFAKQFLVLGYVAPRILLPISDPLHDAIDDKSIRFLRADKADQQGQKIKDQYSQLGFPVYISWNPVLLKSIVDMSVTEDEFFVAAALPLIPDCFHIEFETDTDLNKFLLEFSDGRTPEIAKMLRSCSSVLQRKVLQTHVSEFSFVTEMSDLTDKNAADFTRYERISCATELALAVAENEEQLQFAASLIDRQFGIDHLGSGATRLAQFRWDESNKSDNLISIIAAHILDLPESATDNPLDTEAKNALLTAVIDQAPDFKTEITELRDRVRSEKSLRPFLESSDSPEIQALVLFLLNNHRIHEVANIGSASYPHCNQMSFSYAAFLAGLRFRRSHLGLSRTFAQLRFLHLSQATERASGVRWAVPSISSRVEVTGRTFKLNGVPYNSGYMYELSQDNSQILVEKGKKSPKIRIQGVIALVIRDLQDLQKIESVALLRPQNDSEAHRKLLSQIEFIKKPKTGEVEIRILGGDSVETLLMERKSWKLTFRGNVSLRMRDGSQQDFEDCSITIPHECPEFLPPKKLSAAKLTDYCRGAFRPL
jgi:hypothetical protein